MIQRSVLLRLHAQARDRRDAIGLECLRLLRSRPMVSSASVAAWSPRLESEHPGWDLAITVVFVDAAALEAYERDPVHAAFVRDRLAPRVESRSAFSLELLDDAADPS